MNLFNIKLALRYLYRNKVFSLINLLGLSIGLAAAIYVSVMVWQETSYNKFFKDAARTYQVTQTMKSADRSMSAGFCYAPVGPEIRDQIAGVEDYCRISESEPQSFAQEETFNTIENVRYADSNIFKFTGLKLKLGSVEEALNQPAAIILTEAEAQRIFGRENPMGKTLKSENGNDLTVTGIAINPPHNSDFPFGAIISISSIEYWRSAVFSWSGGMQFVTLIKLSPETDYKSLVKLFPPFLEDRANKMFRQAGWELILGLQPLSRIHLHSNLDYNLATIKPVKSLFIIVSIALLILVMAIINYINLSTAMSYARVKETGIRKILGATRKRIRVQMFAESGVLALISGFVALVLLQLFYPFLNRFTQSNATFANDFGKVIHVAITVVLAVGLLSGLSPVLLLSKQKVKAGLQGKISGLKRNVFRNILVVIQFFMAIVLACLFIVIQKQGFYVANKNLGFNKENLICMNSAKGFRQQEAAVLKQELLKIPDIKASTFLSAIPGRGLTQNGYRIANKEDIQMLHIIYCDEDFLKCFEIKLDAGRDFNSPITSDQQSMIVNSALVNQMGWTDPIGKQISRNGDSEVIGMVKDFNFNSLYSKVEPLIISVNIKEDGAKYYQIAIRYQTANISGLLEKIGKVWQSQFPGTPFDYTFMNDYLARNYTNLDNNKQMLSLFSLLALFISGIGLFGLSAYMIRGRQKEIGIRKVNGATIREIMVILNLSMLKWVAVAIIPAYPVAYYLMNRWLENFAFKTPVSWWIFVLAGLSAFAIAILAVNYESFLAARRNPVESLHHE